jgi:hypothetical protein
MAFMIHNASPGGSGTAIASLRNPENCEKIPEGGKFFDFRAMVPLTAK